MLRVLRCHQYFGVFPSVVPPTIASMLPSINHSIALQGNRGLRSSTTTFAKRKYKKSTYLKGIRSIITHYYEGLDHGDLNNYIARNPQIQDMEKPQLDEVLKILKTKDYTWEEIQKHKEVLLFTPKQIQERQKYLADISISKPTLHELMYGQAYMLSTVGFLQERKVLCEDVDIIQHLCEQAKPLELTETFIEEFKSQYTGNKDVMLSDLYSEIIREYLCKRFPSDVDAIEDLFNSRWVPPWKPLSSIPGICDIIIHSLKLDFSELSNKLSLLEMDPINVHELLVNYPSLGGVSTKETAVQIPGLFLLPVPHVKRWVNLLWKYNVKEFKFTIETLRLFKRYDFGTIEKRLKVMKEIPEWPIICLSEQLFVVMRKPDALKRLLDVMHSGQAISTIKSATQVSSIPSMKRSRLTHDQVVYIAKELNMDEVEISELVNSEVRSNFGMANTRVVLELLFNFGFTQDQILNGIQLLGFQSNLVQEALLEFPQRPEAQPFDEWMDNPYVLHLLAYCIKKDAPHLQISTES